MGKSHMWKGEEICVGVCVRKSERYQLEDFGVKGYY